ncbi:MAG TPA: dienelactone hydrolase family protein [Candidatus Binataceae bacterium]|nr:dienelactone hydrolase family protein [Candidatus Binataceae bacterium]
MGLARVFGRLCLVALLVLIPIAAGAEEIVHQAPPFPVGVSTRNFVPRDWSYDWRNARTEALVTTIWYPAKAGSLEQRQWVGPPDAPIASAGRAAPDADLPASPPKFPLILVSHGSGGSAPMMAWLGTRLAAQGYIAAAVNHPGNNALEPYTTRGFVEWSERATDLSRVLDAMLADRKFGERIDQSRIGAAGFSLGGFTVIELAGGIGTLDSFRAFCSSPHADAMCKDQLEFPHLGAWATITYLVSPGLRGSIANSHKSHSDSRIRAVFAIAPALGPAFAPETLGKISLPVEIVAGADDPVVPVASSARYFADHIPNAKLTLYPGGVGHYTFLGMCTENGKKSRPAICNDAAGVDRTAIHEETAKAAVEFFNARLPAH